MNEINDTLRDNCSLHASEDLSISCILYPARRSGLLLISFTATLAAGNSSKPLSHPFDPFELGNGTKTSILRGTVVLLDRENHDSTVSRQKLKSSILTG